MKAAVIHGINDITVDEVPDPPVGPKEVKVKIAYCGLCGTDPENLEGRFGRPANPGWVGGSREARRLETMPEFSLAYGGRTK